MRIETIFLKEYFPPLGEDGCNARVEIYRPDNLTEIGRSMIVCPGGGYVMCSEREAEPIALQFLPEGYNVFVLHYSVSPHRFPQQLREVAALLELIYQNAEEWHCDTSKIGIIGFSAGGHLAAHYSTMYDCEEVRELFPESKPVNATILGYPVITANPEYAHQGSVKSLLGYYPEHIGTEEDKFSCEYRVSEKTSPTFIWHTCSDSFVPVENSLFYASALSKYKVPFELHIYPFGEHGLSTADELTNDELGSRITHVHAWIDAVKKWLKLIF